MISDAFVTATCDCCETDHDIELKWVCRGYTDGYYDSSDSTIKRALESIDWVMVGTGEKSEHYCCEECMRWRNEDT